jgi:predicted Zn-dependent peptidase
VDPISTREWPAIGSTELVFPNGLKVAYKQTAYLDDQVLISGWATGGLSEVGKKRFHNCSCASMLAGEVGVFGFKPELMADILAGKRVHISPSLGAYRRTFSGEQSPLDLESSLQMVHLLFTNNVTPVPEDLKVIMGMTAEYIDGLQRDPQHVFSDRVRYINYGNCWYFKPMTSRQFLRVDPFEACAFFSQCFRNPKEFTIALVGAVDPAVAVPLIRRYLGGIPACAEPAPVTAKELTPLPFNFPKGSVHEEVRVAMTESINSTQLTFPVVLTLDKDIGSLAEVLWVSLAARLLESRLLNILRFKYGEVYSVQVGAFFGAEAPSVEHAVRGDVAINFSCDPDAAARLRELALDELSRLQVAGPSEEDISTVLELEVRAFELGQQENSHWLERLTSAYSNRKFNGDVDKAFQTRERVRTEVLLPHWGLHGP